jgi:hypothetical protein
VAFWTHACTAAIPEIYLELLESVVAGPPAGSSLQAAPGLSRSALEKQAKLACKAIRVFGSIFRIGQPSALLFQGVYEQLAGKPSRAREALEQCVEVSREQAMPYEEGRALFELGRRADKRSPDRRRNLEKAAEIFASLTAGHDLRRAEAELRSSSPRA